MPITIAVNGKGGTGKSSLTALMVRELVHAGVKPVLAVDADPNWCLGPMLGVEVETTISDLRELADKTREQVRDIPKQRLIEQWLAQCIAEGEGFDCLTMGQPEGPRCYCFVNSLLKRSISDLKGNYRVIVIDNAAGMEHISRLTVDDIDSLIVVTDATVPAVRAVQRILTSSDSLPVKVGKRFLLWNRMQKDPPEDLRAAVQRFPLDNEFIIPYSNALTGLSTSGDSIMTARDPLPSLREVLFAAGVIKK